MIGFLQKRAVSGIEMVVDGKYRRTVVVRGRPGAIAVSHDPATYALHVEVHHPEPQAVYTILRRVRTMFDVDADPQAIRAHLESDPLLRSRVRRRPGLRLPGGWDPFEIGVRAIIGQQASVAGAAALVGRVTRMFGTRLRSDTETLAWTFPTPHDLGEAPLERAGLTRQRAAAIRALASAVAAGGLTLDGDMPALADRLRGLPGVGPWTAQYVSMRGLSDPDAFPVGDLGLRRAAGLPDRELAARAEQWRPWRAYAAMHLWMETGHDSIHDRRQSGRRAAPGARRRRAPRAALPPGASAG
jgi:AraC family transcriptional regulator of adaptative response / DNA-3-methyladenine glycosylase II